MAETPKAKNDTGASGTDADQADTSSAMSATVSQDRAAGAGEVALAVGRDGTSDSLSGVAASGAVDGGDGQDSLTGMQSADTAAMTSSPWAASTASSAASRVGSGDDTPASDTAASPDTAETPEPAPARSSSSGGGGATRLVVFLLLIVLIGGVGYATYPEWRDEAVPYAEMIGVTLPEAPTESDPDAPTQTASDDTAVPASDDTASTTPVPPTPAPTASDSAPTASDSSVSDSGTSAPAQSAAPQSEPAAATAPQNAPVVSAEAFEALAERVATLEAEIDGLSEAPAAGASAGASDGADSGAADLSERLASLEGRFSALADEMAIVRQGLGMAEDTNGVSAVASELSGRLSDLDSRISTLETQEEGPPPVSSDDLAAVSERVSGLQTSSQDSDAGIIARIDALAASQQELAEKVSQGRNKQEQAGAFLLATNLLAAASNDSGAYAAELDAVQTAALDQPEVDTAIETLRTHAEGVPSEADLRSRFPAVAASIIDASIVGAGDDMVGTALTRIAALVTLRRTETAEGDAIDAIVNRAEAAANAGDLPGAVQALGALDGDPAKVAAPWIAEGQARIAVDRAVRTLQSRALATLSGG